MPATRKRRPPMEIEPGEGKKHEMGESPDEEVREGSEPDDMPMSKHSRKRGMRGAKKTKAPMDGEGCSCGGGKGKKCSCDGGCGYSKKMDSALSPHEYLAACDLGIQDRSNSYIRTHLITMDSATLRTDKKCGNSSIPDNKQCRVGSATAGGRTLRRVATGAAIAGGVAAAAYGASRMRRGGGMRALAPAGGVSSLTRGNSLGNRARRAAYGASTRARSAATNLAEGARSGSFTRAGSLANRARRLSNTVRTTNVGRTARRAGQRVRSGVNSAVFATRRGASFTAAGSIGNRARRAAYGARGAARGMRSRFSRAGALTVYRGRRDSVWAAGFDPAMAS